MAGARAPGVGSSSLGDATRSVRTLGLLLKKTVHRESDAVLVFLTRELGKVTAFARGAQRSRKRFGGALEPIHTLELELLLTRADNYDLVSAQVYQPRFQLVSELARLEAAGRALGWLKRGAMERDPEPLVWTLAQRLLDELDGPGSVDTSRALATAGLSLLAAWGWGFELDTCTRCGKPCPDGKAAWVDATRGGLICSECGGARLRIPGPQRKRLSRAAQGEPSALEREDTTLALELFEAALGAHADIR